ncbi:MauE/DoxX family redox-associated membrane protein [Mucisphaera calidilacus]|uniref:DoxX n=1 Tax=Mucisphaera calidilacus TaxID=2527982 RepID=A0A518BXE9_9BACT|nr:MauE/DoxX family redox-associated membrane protein [Mucisphaera calidilacus]QDU71645.1 DoxX [Mucisphaera calidilacus]
MSKGGLWTDLVLGLNRAAVGLYFTMAGVGKVSGELQNGIGSFYEGPFTSMKPSWLPAWFAYPYGVALPWIEVVVGALLLVGLLTRLMSVLTWLMLLSFTIALVIASGSVVGGTFPWHKNFFLLLITLWFIVVGGGRFALDRTVLGRAAKVATGA